MSLVGVKAGSDGLAMSVDGLMSGDGMDVLSFTMCENASEVNFCCGSLHDKLGDTYHDTTLVPTKLTCGSDLDVASHRSVCTTDVGEDFKPTVWCTTTYVSEDAGNVDL